MPELAMNSAAGVFPDSGGRARSIRMPPPAAATPGGTGAVRQAFELVRMANPDARVFVSDPTWPNHLSILKFMGLPTQSYRYFDSETRAVDFDGMMADLAEAQPGETVLLAPAAASFDQYDSFEKRGEDFIARVKAALD